MAIPRNLANIAPHVNASSTELVVNDGGANLDFRVEGDTNANLLFADAGAEKVGFGTNTFNTNGGVIQVSNGISFPATQSALSDANTLDDYEEGTWTPSYTAGFGAFTSITYGIRVGKYTKIGNQVTIVSEITTNDVTLGTAGTGITISGLPFTPAERTNCTIGYMYGWNFGVITKPIVGWTSGTSILLSNSAYDDTFGAGNYVFGVQGGAGTGRHHSVMTMTYLV